MAVDPSKVKEYTTNLNLPIYKYAGTRWDAMINAVTTMLDGEVGAIKTEVTNARDGELTLDARFQLLVDKDASQDDDILEYSQHATAERMLAEAAAVTAVNAKDEAVAIVYGGEYSVDPDAGHVPIADPDGKLKNGWLNIGSGSDELPTNSYLGEMAYKDSTNLGTVTADTVIVNGRSLDRAVTAIYNNMPHVEAGTASSGILVPDSTEYDFTAQMARFIPPIFIPETMTEEIVVYSDGPLGIFVTTDKKIRVNHYGVYESEPLTVNNDWVEFAFGKDDNLTDTVTVYFIANGVQLGSTTVSDFSDLYIYSLLEGEDGLFWCANQGHGMNNSTGTVRLNNPGDAIGLQYDLGPNEINAAQVTATARPLLGRVPVGGRRNLWTYSNEFSNPVWDSSNQTLSATAIKSKIDPSQNMTLLVPSEGTLSQYMRRGFAGGSGFSFEVEAAGYNYIALNSSNTSTYGAAFDLTTGNVSQPSSAVIGQATMEDLGEGRWRIFIPTSFGSLIALKVSPTFSRLGIGSSQTYDGVSGVLISSGMSEVGIVATPYQRVTTALDITEQGVQDVYYAYFDSVDDILPFTVPAITDGTIVLAGTNGIWIDSLTVSAGTFNLGPTTYTGGPAGILAVVGDVIGMFVIGRAITAGEQTALINYFKGKGAPGVFELGEEEMLGAAPFADISNIVTNSDFAVTLSSGEIRVERVDDSIGEAATRPSLDSAEQIVTGQRYLYNIRFSGASQSAYASAIWGGAGVALGNLYNVGVYRVVLTGSTQGNGKLRSRFNIAIGATPGGNIGDFVTIDTLSLRKIALNTGE